MDAHDSDVCANVVGKTWTKKEYTMNGNYKGTEHYTLTKTENGWHGDPNDCEWQWFDFPDLTFTDDGDCRFELEAEAIDAAVELDEYREFLAILSNEIEELRQQIDAVG